jgi:cytochrome P450
MALTQPSSTSGEQHADAVLLELVTNRESCRDPYRAYAEMRSAAPIFRSSFGTYVLTRYADCWAVLRDPRCGKDWAGFMRQSGIEDWQQHPSLQGGDEWLLFANPPAHTRLRRLVAKAFTPRMVSRLEPRMEAMIDELLVPIADAGGGDLLDALAFPLPCNVIGDLLGVPEADRASFREPVRISTRTLEVGVTPEQIAAADEAVEWSWGYFQDLIVERRAHPGDDLLSGMLAVEEQGDRLTTDEIATMALLLFSAGFETTTNLIGNGTFALLNHPSELRKLREQPALITPAVEELLRYDASIQISGRFSNDDIEVGGQAIPAGSTIMTVLGAANRDPARFADPDRLDVGRRDIEPLSFGSGIHYCLGASLARRETALALTRLLARFASIELAGAARFRDQLGFRGLESLPVRCGNA